MATSTITNTIKDAAGNNIPGVRVVARIHPHPAFRTVAGSEVAPVVETITDSNGVWTLALERTADITPSNTYYEIIEYAPDQRLRHLIQVGASDQSLFAALITVPPAGDLTAYLTQAAGDARYQAIGALGGTPATLDNAAGTNGVSATAARVDHKHALATGHRFLVLCTAATRPGAPSTGDRIYETDTKKSLVYNGSAWVPDGNLQIVTAATRPATTFAGQAIYESDTEELLVRNGAGQWRRPWQMPWGVVGYAEVTANQTGITNTVTDLTSLTITATFVANRRIKITLEGQFLNATSGETTKAYIRESTNTLAARQVLCSNNLLSESFHVEKIITPSAGSHTYKGSMNRSSGSGNTQLTASATEPAFILIEDLGPNGAAA